MAKTVVGLMDSGHEAEAVVRDLTSTCGCSREDIGLAARNESSGGISERSGSGEMASGALTGAGTGAAVGGVLGLVAGTASLAIPGLGPIIAAGPIAAALAGAGIGAAAGGLIGALANIGVPEDEAEYYAEGVKRGGTLITLHARDERTAQCALRVMQEHGAVDIQQRAGQWRGEGWSEGSWREGAIEGQAIPVAKEELAVGKREVSKGDVRVRTRTQEKPVEASVRLREERADVERRPVDRPLAAGDNAFQEREIEVSETAEEPVVSKRARVTEEVRIGKQASERQETVHDKVRETKVDVERTSGSAYRGPERRRRQSAYSGAERRMAMR